MSICKIFYLSVIVGLCNGVASMYLLNGILGHAKMSEAWIAFFTIGGVGVFTLYKLIVKLKPMWTITVQYPISRPEK